MKHRNLLLALAALTLATGAFAQTNKTMNSDVRKAAQVKKAQADRKNSEDVNKQLHELVKDANMQNNQTTEKKESQGRRIRVKNTQTIETGTDGTRIRVKPSTSTTTSSQSDNDKTRRQAIRDYFDNNTSKDNAAALTRTAIQDKKLEPVIITSTGDAMVLQTREHDEPNNPVDAVYAIPDQSRIYPGAIIYANQDLANGRPTLVGLHPGTVTLTIDFDNGGETTKRGVINDASHVKTAIEEMIRECQNRGTTPPMNAAKKSTTYSSASKMALDLNVSADFLKASAKVNMETTSSETSLVEVQDYTEGYYTVYAQLESDKDLYFGDDVTKAQIENKIKNNGGAPLAMITSVTYGRRAYRFKEYKTKDFNFKGTQSGSGAGVKMESEEEISESSKYSNEWMYIKGGSSKLAKEIFTSGSIDEAIGKCVGEQIGLNNQGVMLTYESAFLASGRVCTTNGSVKYNETKYVKCPHSVSFEVNTDVTGVAGDNIKFKVMYDVIRVTGNMDSGYKYEIVRGKGKGEEAYLDYRDLKIDYKSRKTFTLPLADVEKDSRIARKDECYVWPRVFYTIRCKSSAASGDWHETENGYFDLTGIEKVRVELKGNHLKGGKGVYVHSNTTPKPLGH